MLSNNNVEFNVHRKSDGLEIIVGLGDRDHVRFHTTKIDHTESKSYASYIKNAISSSGCADIQPINGVYQKKFIKNMFKQKNVNDLSDQLKYLKGHEEEKYVKIFVLDIKDTKCKYDSIKDINAAEKEVEDFFAGKEPKEKSPRRDIYKIVKDNNINYFFCEGRLKHYLLNNVFSSQQTAFFQQSNEGKGIICQLAEVLLDAFKLGHSVSVTAGGKQHTLSPESYLILLRNKEKLDIEKNPITIAPITLFTLYPEHYKELYSIREKYCESLSSAFKVDHNYDDETKTTAIKLSL